MKELLEQYVMEAVQMREQQDLLVTLVGTLLVRDKHEVSLEDLKETTPPKIEITNGIVYVTAG